MGERLDAAVYSRWNYYGQAAKAMGQKEGGGQENSSLAWFYYSREPEELNALTKAFLGDPGARESLFWDEPLPEELRGGAPRHGWVEAAPNANQLKAIRTALTQPISFIQGPPGTGKTKMILNLLACIACQENPDGTPRKTVAVVSQNNTAIENIEESIAKYRDGDSARRRVWERFAPLGNTEKRKRFTEPDAYGWADREAAIGKMGFRDEAGEPVRGFTSPPLRQLPRARKIQYRLPEGTGLVARKEPYITASAFLRRYPLITSTLHALRLCFADSDKAEFQYDYVIVDETSQAGLLTGLVAMSCARHLVLVGDEEQLSAFLGARERTALNGIDPELARAVGGLYRIRDNESFLSVCLDVFLGRENEVGERGGGIAAGREIKTLLREHYRCHPGIIGYCNAHVYDGRLLPCRPDRRRNREYGYDPAVKVPVKVLWYEGDYYEPEGRERLECFKRNRRQTTIFLEEEWPELVERFRQAAPEKLSVCILTPFKDQRDELMGRIVDAIRALPERDRLLFGPVEETSEEELLEACYSKTVPALTINKAQGEEYDIVYLLPVEDGPEVKKKWPWSQGKAIVNVAVSRAKNELRLIVSSDLMSAGVRRKLETRGELQHPFGREEPVKADDGRYIQYLVDYVMDRVPPDGDFSEYPHQGQFGFHKSRLTSIFDQISRERARHAAAGRQAGPGEAAPAPKRCVELALANILSRYRKERDLELELYCGVRIRDIRDAGGRPIGTAGWEEELRSDFENSAHLDFVICQKGGRLLLAIDVDGGKNEIAGKLGAACCLTGNRGKPETDGSFAFLRLPSDGSTYWETEELWEQADEALREAAGRAGRFPIEALIDRQLGAADTEGYRFTPLSLTKTVEEWRQRRRKDCGAFLKSFKTAGELQRRMAQGPAPLLCEIGGEARTDAPPERWRPTESGAEWGILRGYRLDGAGRPYCCPFYPESARRELPDRICAGRTLPEH